MENLSDQSDAELSKIFASLFVDQVNSQDVNAVLLSQENIIRRLDLTNANLKNSVNTSSERLNAAVKDFNAHVQTLTVIKKDLDHIFKKIRAIKTKLANKYPSEYENASHLFKKKGDSEDEDDEALVKAYEKNTKINDEKQKNDETSEQTKPAATSNTNTPDSSNPQQNNNSTFFDFNIIKNAKNEINKISASGKDLVGGILNKK